MIKGKELLELLASQTGLPQNLIERELKALLHKHGKDSSKATIEDIRELLVDYLQEVLLKAKDQHENDERSLSTTQ